MRSLPALLTAALLCLSAAQASAILISSHTAHTTTLLPTGDVLIAGGINDAGTILATTEIVLTSKDGSIIAGQVMSVARSSHTATLMGNGCVLIAGGMSPGGVVRSDAQVYDPISKTFITPASSMTSPRFNHTATLLNDGRVLLCGGQSDNAGTVSGTCDLFTPTGTMGPGTCSGSFTASVSMLHARTLHTAVLLQDGKVWVAGGWDGAGYTPTTEKYIPSPPSGAGSFSSASPMIQARSNHTATMMGDGRILVAGGVDGQNVLENRGILDTLEIYDPVANNTIPGPVLEARREMHTSVLMNDGRVLLFGGLGNITTTYYTPPDMLFGGAAPLAATINVAAGGAVTAGASVPSIPIQVALNSPVVGTIYDGFIDFAQPSVAVAWGTLMFPDPLVVSLAGQQATCNTASPPVCGQISIANYNLPGLTGTATFLPVSSLSLTASPNGGNVTTSGGGTIISGGDVPFASLPVSGLTVFAGAQLSGNISVSGTVTAPDYTVNITAGSISFANSSVGAGGTMTIIAPDVTGLTGTVAYNSSTALTVNNSIVNEGTLNFSPTPLDGTSGKTQAALLSGTTAGFAITLNFPPDLYGSTISGNINITSGKIIGSADYTATLNGGMIPFSGTISAAGVLVTNVTAWDLQGTLTWKAGTVNDGDTMHNAGDTITIDGSVSTFTATNLNLAGALSASLSGTMNITAANNLNITGASLKVHPSTAVIRGMVFGQGEYYEPKSNSVSFDPGLLSADPSIETFGQTATLLPPSDMMLVGGSDCVGASCASMAAIDRGVTYLMQQSPGNFTTNPLAANLNTARALHTATLLPDGTILAAGGTDGLNILSSAEIFDPVAKTFTATAGPMSNPRDLHTATLMTNGRVLIAGGTSTNSTSTGSISAVDIYYPDTRTFIPTTPMAAARSNHTATLLPDGKVMVVGGFGAGDVITGTAEIFDPEHMTWTSAAPLPGSAAAALHTATLLKDGRLMIAGGVSSAGVLNTVFAYTPATDSWATLAPMPSKLRSHTATLLLDGRVLVAGGNDGNGETGSSFIYDPVLNTWTPAVAPTASALTYPRFDHTATLLPDGSVMISGGSNKFGVIPPDVEIYHVDQSSWTPGAPFVKTRAFHTMTLAADGNVYAIGGADGVIGGNGTSILTSAEKGAFSTTPDVFGKNQPPSLRQSSFTITSVTPLQANESFILAGSKFLGGTEAGGGGAAAANSSFAVPHLILQKVDASDFILDLTTSIFSATTPPTNSALTAPLPSASASMPSGWYNARVGVNDVYSNGTFVQVGPARPASAPASLTGTAQGISSITWNWGAVAGADGYNLYIASNGVFIATVAFSAGSSSFTETGLAANSINQIRVAGYTLTGDGPSALSPLTAVTPVTVITKVTCGSGGSGDTTTSIPWSWTPIPSAQSYNVYDSTTGALITVTSSPNFYDTGLGTSTARVLRIGAVSAGIEAALTAPSTCYTLAAPPLPPLVSQNLPVMDASTDTVTLNWIANGNPANTLFESVLTRYDVSPPATVTITTSAFTAAFTGLLPSSYYSAQIFAVNGAGALAGPLTAGTTFTLPAQPASISIVGTTPVTISVAWDATANSTMTYYQILASTDTGFTGIISTAVPFSSRYNGSTFTVAGLLTGQQYFISVTAENPFGQTTVPIKVATVTYNGGAPTGSLSGLIPAIGGSEFSGTIGGLTLSRYVDMRSPGGTFPADTVVTISTYSLLDPGHVACDNAVPGIGGAGIALNIENDPILQPIRPLYLTGGYSSAEAGSFPGPLSQLALARYDPLSGTCIPLQTVFNPAARTFVAALNHFSLYQLVSVPLATTADTARIFPNPFHAATDGYITIDRIPPAARVRVFTLRGERILDAVADGAGNVTWRGDNTAGRSVASGLYLVVIEAGGTKKIMKLAVIR